MKVDKFMAYWVLTGEKSPEIQNFMELKKLLLNIEPQLVN